jgi:hypothetical protein
MRVIGLVAVGAALLSTSAWAQTSGTACPAISEAYDLALKEIAYANVKAVMTRSAAQATQVASEQSTQVAMAHANLDLLIASRCPLPKQPVSEKVYMAPALECHVASGEVEMKAKCDRKTWTTQGPSSPPGP